MNVAFPCFFDSIWVGGVAAEGGNEASESLFQNGYLCCSKRSRLKSDNDFLFNLLLLLFFQYKEGGAR